VNYSLRILIVDDVQRLTIRLIKNNHYIFCYDLI
jgi:hypothetical protein